MAEYLDGGCFFDLDADDNSVQEAHASGIDNARARQTACRTIRQNRSQVVEAQGKELGPMPLNLNKCVLYSMTLSSFRWE